jgi:hypothetical protein
MRITFLKLDLGSKSTFSRSRSRSRSLLGLTFAAGLAAAGCGGGGSSTPGTAGSSGGTAGTTGSAGTTGAAGTSGAGGTTGTGGSSAGGTGGGAQAGTGGGAAGSTGGNPAGAAGTGGGAQAGTGGGAQAGTGGGAQAGRGGSTAGSGGGTAGASGRGGSAGGGTAGSGGGGAPTCPANATFCSGFESSALPTGAVYMVNAAPGEWTRDFAIDTAQKNSGNSSVRVKSATGETGTSGSAYKMLAVPATMNAFWVRFFIRSDVAIGMNPHNVFAGGSVGSGPNDATIEFADDVGVSFNTSDDVKWPTGYGRINGNMMPYMLAAATWHCVEISFDGPGRVQQLFVGGTQLINATSYPTSTSMSWPLRFFKFGYNALHAEVSRAVWFDDVAVAPTRIGGCP